MATHIDTPGRDRLPDSLIDAWRRVPCAVAADQLAGIAHAGPEIRSLRPLRKDVRLVGSAITALCEPEHDYGAVHHAIDVAKAGDVLVIAAGGRSGSAMIGELLSTAARLKGIAGVVVDGAVRDSAMLSEWDDFPLFTRWVTPRGPSSMNAGCVNREVNFAGIKVSPYDIVIGDCDGVVFVPYEAAEKKLAACLARVDAEVGWQRELASGKSTIEVFKVPQAKI